MSDRELLELAAKAAGYGVKPHASQKHTPHLMFTFNGHNWNPLTDDGDALRLAVKLGFVIEVMKNKALYSEDELCAATRREIVKAAAAIGETK